MGEGQGTAGVTVPFVTLRGCYAIREWGGVVPTGCYAIGSDILRLVLQLQFRNTKGVPMHEETFNLSIRKFLKIVGINSQREIEQAVRKALEEGHIKGDETFPASVTLAVPELNLSFKIDGEIRLQ